MSIGGVCAARVLEAAGWAPEAALSKTPGVPFDKPVVFNPIVARPCGQKTRLKPCLIQVGRTSEFALNSRLLTLVVAPVLASFLFRCEVREWRNPVLEFATER
jgi:hypothetical protein